jgi:hypothetical protein
VCVLHRLLTVEQQDFQNAVKAAEERQKKLFERHKKYDVNTTFLPRLDGAVPREKGLGDEGSQGAAGRVVKSLATELEQLEMHSTSFPEDPILRSRSAKQQQRKISAAAGAASNKPAVRSAGANSGATITPRRVESLPTIKAVGSQKKTSFADRYG